MADVFDVFLSYSSDDRPAATVLRSQLERCGLFVFHDVESIRAGDLWLDRLQAAAVVQNAEGRQHIHLGK